jgi:hypothetical protein
VRIEVRNATVDYLRNMDDTNPIKIKCDSSKRISFNLSKIGKEMEHITVIYVVRSFGHQKHLK